MKNTINSFLATTALGVALTSSVSAREQIDPRNCYQTFGDDIIKVSCENISSILEQHPWASPDSTEGKPWEEQLNIFRNRTGEIILLIHTPPKTIPKKRNPQI